MTSEPLGPEGHFLDGLRRGTVLLQRCTETGRFVFYPRAVSPWSGRATLEWVQASGRGVVHSTTVVRRPEKHGGDYNVSLVDLDEGVRMMSCVVGIAPTDVAIGQRVVACIDAEAETPRVLFAPAERHEP